MPGCADIGGDNGLVIAHCMLQRDVPLQRVGISEVPRKDITQASRAWNIWRSGRRRSGWDGGVLLKRGACESEGRECRCCRTVRGIKKNAKAPAQNQLAPGGLYWLPGNADSRAGCQPICPPKWGSTRTHRQCCRSARIVIDAESVAAIGTVWRRIQIPT